MRQAALAVLVVWGCYHPNAATGVPCAANGDCPAGQTCDTHQAPPVCVGTLSDARAMADAPPDAPPACTDDSTCAASAPICDQTTHTCRGCIADAECTNGVCVEYAGTCVDDSATLFLAPGGLDVGACTRAAPCGTFAYAFTLLTSAVHVVRIGDGAYAEAVHLTTQNIGQVVLSGEDRDPAGAMMTATGAPVFVLDNGTNALLEGVTVSGGTSDGIQLRSSAVISRVRSANNSGYGINVNAMDQNGKVTVVDSTIGGNSSIGLFSGKGIVDAERDVILDNAGGGVRVQQGPVTLVNCIIAKNGTGTSTGSNVGGARLDNLLAGSHVELDTIAYNSVSTSTTVVAGLQTTSAFTAANMIFADNGPLGSAQYSQTVSVTHSLFEGATAPQGMGNKTGTAGFVDVMNGDFHLTTSSDAIDAAGASSILVDVDGDVRPYGSADDMGADEYHP